jgi:hypothetical protein
MKKLLKYIIKLIFVVIMPIVYIYIAIDLYATLIESWALISLMIILLLTTILNVGFFYSSMKNTHLLPEMSYEFVPMIGFAIGLDINSQIIIVFVPFCVTKIHLERTK